MSDREQEPGPTHTPYGQQDPYGQASPYGQPAGQSYPYGQQPAYGAAPQQADRRPGTVTAAAWLTIVFSAVTAFVFGFTGLAMLVARDQVITEMERVPEFQDANIDADAAVGVLVAVMVGLVVWSLIAIVLAVLVLRRSNVARILLVISCAATAILSLLSVASGVTLAPLVAAIATVVLLFTGGASDWFKRVPSSSGGYPGGGYPGGPSGYPAQPYGSPYGAQPGQDAPQPPPAENPYGQPPPAGNPYGQPPSAENPYGQLPPSEGGSDHPPRDYPGR
jgi:hypothetical protein